MNNASLMMLLAFQNQEAENANACLSWDLKPYAEVSEFATHWDDFQQQPVPSVQMSATEYPMYYHNYDVYITREQEINALRKEIQRCQAVIREFLNAWWYAEHFGISSTGYPIVSLGGSAKLVAIWKYIGHGSMYAGIAFQNDYVGCKDKLPALYRLYNVLTGYYYY